MSLKLCFLAPSTYGKSTAVKILKNHYSLSCFRIGEPLYQLQSHFYQFLDKKMNGEQDGELLQFYGYKVRKEDELFLMRTFYEKIQVSSNLEFVINDDCRPLDYPFLKEMGFLFIKIDGIAHQRIDHTVSDTKSSLEWQCDIPFDYTVSNHSTLEDYEKNLISLIERITYDQQVLCSSCPKDLQLQL